MNWDKVEGLFFLFGVNILFSGIMVISALNPVHSVLWLIVAFANASALFILLNVEFIALIFLIVYVGAIAILFLFVIMMLNLTDLGGSEDMSNYLLAGLIIGIVFLFEIWIWQNHHGVPSTTLIYSAGANYWDYIASYANIEIIGRILYTKLYYLFIIASFVLLVAMIGAIVLTHDTGTEIKRQDIFIQTSRQLWL